MPAALLLCNDHYLKLECENPLWSQADVGRQEEFTLFTKGWLKNEHSAWKMKYVDKEL